MTNIERQLEERRKLVGAQTQNKAFEQLEKQKHSPFVTIENKETGEIERVKKCVADIYKAKGTATNTKLVFSVPDLSHIDWKN
jgi:low affinity Fe/Cu permease